MDGFIKRFRGAKWKNNPDPYKVPIDFGDYNTDNILHLHYEKVGSKKKSIGYLACPTPTVVSESGTYYSFGRATDGNGMIPLKSQLEIVRHVTGTHKSLLGSCKQRREEQWQVSMEGNESGKDFDTLDLPTLFDQYAEVLNVKADEDGESTLTSRCLNKFKRELITLL